MATLNVFLKVFVGFTFGLILSGCGFKLAGESQSLGELKNNVAVSAPNELYFLRNQLVAQLQQRQVQVVPAIDASVQVVLISEDLQRRAVTRNAVGRATEFDIQLLLTYRIDHVSPEQNQINDTELKTLRASSQRSYWYNNDQLLAADHRERALLVEMRQEIIERILFQLRTNAE
ncbi:LPS assembly lipoprotein LptE [Pleionea litopenaei]|uniref:LPS-assembly lipoprotein LptE n=1 Tax=Pleionea litopenaei TaxID=3070815 RepID=A0AA51X5Y4_9GAMM|nr:LPS assembly lipoprotein LptE [Pleionea sp. HL-JVS1]WMS86558.1 hypothetical protein Q9312_15160 [Pleionea sp. HL-JVS1]